MEDGNSISKKCVRFHGVIPALGASRSINVKQSENREEERKIKKVSDFVGNFIDP